MNILEEAAQIISGPRRQAYGDVRESFASCATLWSVILKAPVSPEQAALCMIGLKLLREANKSHRDNRVDICGYAALLDLLREKL